jgi:hypothetical protein
MGLPNSANHACKRVHWLSPGFRKLDAVIINGIVAGPS